MSLSIYFYLMYEVDLYNFISESHLVPYNQQILLESLQYKFWKCKKKIGDAKQKNALNLPGCNQWISRHISWWNKINVCKYFVLICSLHNVSFLWNKLHLKLEFIIQIQSFQNLSITHMVVNSYIYFIVRAKKTPKT